MPSLLEKHLQKDLLRFLTCGSVDDGKSTLIGRLLYDAGLVPDDQLATLRADQLKRGLSEPDLSLLLDGLQAEREQGITIDVAYRYFSTEQRKFIVADTPGHEQYTANMVTGASHCQLAPTRRCSQGGTLPNTSSSGSGSLARIAARGGRGQQAGSAELPPRDLSADRRADPSTWSTTRSAGSSLLPDFSGHRCQCRPSIRADGLV